jgi:hypothetical protein
VTLDERLGGFDTILALCRHPQPTASEISAYFRAGTAAVHACSESVGQVPERVPFNDA